MLRYSGLFLITLLIGMAACNEQPASPIEEIDPPSLPTFDGLPYDFGVFEEVEASSSEVSTPEYDQVEEPDALLRNVLALMMYRIDESILPALNDVMKPSHEVKGAFDRGTFIWEYDLETGFYNGMQINHPALLRSEEVEDEYINWGLFIFGEDTGEGEFKLVEGNQNEEATEASWRIFDLEKAPDKHQSVYLSWNTEADSLSRAEVVTSFDQENEEPLNYTVFELEEDDMIIRFRRVIADQTIQHLDATLSLENGEGEMTYRLGDEEDQKRYCWDSDFEMIECE